jgi:hypothetical protein
MLRSSDATAVTITKCSGCVTSVAAVFIKLGRTDIKKYHNPTYIPNIPISGRAGNKPTLELPLKPLANTTAMDENKTNSNDVRSINANIFIFPF